MGSIRALGTNNKLFIDFRYKGNRCREYTTLDETPANRNKLQKILDRIETEIKLGTFDYARYFPGSRMAGKISGSVAVSRVTVASPAVAPATTGMPAAQANTGLPTFKEFAKTWVAENEVAWRRSHRKTVDDSAGLELDAFVTVTISTDERQIIGYTLARLTDPEKTLQQLEDMLRSQVGREPLTANLF